VILKIGTRGSKLALAQSAWIKEGIQKQNPSIRVDLVKIKTTGDKILDSPLSTIGGKGLFVKEIEEALFRKEIHVAVHSMKDLPAELPEGLALAVFPEREDPRDAFISTDGTRLEALPQGARVGTGSLRRVAQLRHRRPDLEVVPLRGNVDTRLKKLETEGLQGIVLAVAGLRRLGLEHLMTQVISSRWILPAVGQGALGLEVREDDGQSLEVLHFLNHWPTEAAVKTERAFLKELQGGCQVPIAGFASLKEDQLFFQGMVASIDGSRVFQDQMTGPKDEAADIGVSVARRLLGLGAREILAEIYGKSPVDVSQPG